MSAGRFRRSPPGGAPIGLASLRELLGGRELEAVLRRALAQLVGCEEISLHASGREALRVAFRELAQRTGRREVVIPAYTCFSIPAAAVAAGLRVRLVDVDQNARLDLEALTRLPLNGVCAIVVCNLFGLPEPVAPVAEIARECGAAVIDDAAQCLGGAGLEGPVGGRGSLGVLSFARGKPLQGLGGGGLAWSDTTGPAPASPPCRFSDRARALVRALGYDLALRPLVFSLLAGIPALGIGDNRFEPDFARGPIDPASLALAAVLAPRVAGAGRERARRAESLARGLEAQTRLRPLLAAPGCRGVYPRLAAMAPDESERGRALRAARQLGASGMYPTALDRVPGLQPHLEGGPACPGAAAVAARLITLPVRGVDDALLAALARG
jgi:hypothetical protein